MLPVSNLNDFATGGGMLNPSTGAFNPAGAPGADKFGNPAQNSNPFGFTAPTGPSTQALVPYYNKATGETWNAPSGGYTPPSADWFQGSPGNSTVAPLPGFAPGMDPLQSTINAGMAPSFLPQAEQDRLNALNLQSMNQQPKALPTNNDTSPPVGNINFTQPYMPIMGGNPNVGQQPRPMPQQPAPTPNTGGLSALVPQQPMVNRPVSGLNSLVRPQSFMRNQIAPRAGSLPSLRFNPRLNRSLPIPFTRPTFRR